MKQSVHFGAGNIGRGFIGLLLTKSGYRVTFLDVNDVVIQALKERGSYTVELVGESTTNETVVNVTGINSKTELEAANDALYDADLITTAVGPSILPIIARQLVATIEKRAARKTERFLNIIACENTIGGSKQLENALRTQLSPEALAHLESWVGFPNAAVDRIVPNQINEDPLHVKVEPFFEWVVDTRSIKGELIIEGVHFTDKLEAFIERKLFTVNTGHATCAYAAYRKGIMTIPEAMQDKEISELVRDVIRETGTLIVTKYGFDPGEQENYIQKTLKRFKNPYIVDEVTRVGRSPLRKLSPQDRFIKPMLELDERGLSTRALRRSVANCLHYDFEKDDEALKLQTAITEKGVAQALSDATGLPLHSPLIKQIIELY
ncbi:MAG: mannitol-1-phosphate 5-dehydrogenase [Erysipelotrichaceae bacterium]